MAISAGTYTIGGTGTDYPGVTGWDDAIADMLATLTGALTLDVRGPITMSTSFIRNCAGYVFKLTTTNTYHNGVYSTAQNKITLANNIVIKSTGYTLGSEIIIEKLVFESAAKSISIGVEHGAIQRYTRNQFRYNILKNVVIGASTPSIAGVYFYFKGNKLFDGSYINSYSFGAGDPCYFENNTIYNPSQGGSAGINIRPWGLGYSAANIIVQNNYGYAPAGEAFSITSGLAVNPQGYNNAAEDDAATAAAWSASSGNRENIQPEDEFLSVDSTNKYFLKLVESVLYNSGKAPGVTTEDIAGYAIPYEGNYPIGCHVYVVQLAPYDNIVIDSGAVYRNYGEADEELIGATRGGNRFGIEQQIIDMGYDGAMKNVKGARRLVRLQPYIVANLVDFSPNFLARALPASSITNSDNMAIITRAAQLALSDYATNYAIVGEVAGKNQPIVCIIHNAMADSNFQISMKDKNESVLQIRFKGHYASDDLEAEPWAIRYPKS